jgi:hypothetical protein
VKAMQEIFGKGKKEYKDGKSEKEIKGRTRKIRFIT